MCVCVCVQLLQLKQTKQPLCLYMLFTFTLIYLLWHSIENARMQQALQSHIFAFQVCVIPVVSIVSMTYLVLALYHFGMFS